MIPKRLLLIPLVYVPAALYAWWYLAHHDLERSWRRFQRTGRLSWPEPTRSPDGMPAGVRMPDWLITGARLAVLAAAVGLVAVTLSRLWHRRRRAKATVTWELELGRDDLANPYRVQEAFEGIVGACTSRWYRRVWQGQDHLALETHRLPDRSIRFTISAPVWLGAALSGSLEDLYPDVRMSEVSGRPDWTGQLVRLKKRRSFVLSIQTTRDYEHAFSESLVALLGSLDRELTVQLVLTPAPEFLYRRARRQLKSRERQLNRRDRRDPVDPGMDSVVEAKELKGALESQHRSLCLFDLRVAGDDPDAVQRTAGLFSQLRSENEFARRHMRLRRRLYAHRLVRAQPNPLPGLHTGVLSTSELPTLWQLPRARAKHARLPRATVRRALAPPGIDRDPGRVVLEDERGPVSIHPDDRKYGVALMGGQGSGKTATLARLFRADAADPGRGVVLIDPKGPLAELALGIVPAQRTVHYIDLGRPEAGFNPLAVEASPGARASVFIRALIEANPPGAIQARSDDLLRQTVAAVCAVEAKPTVWHLYRMLSAGDDAYREQVLTRLAELSGMDFALYYWRREFPELLKDKSRAGEVLDPPLNKLRRLLSTGEVDLVLRHPHAVDIEGAIERGEVLIVNGAKAVVGEDNTVLITQLLLQLLHRAVQAQQRLPRERRRRISLFIDEAHNVLTPSVATMLAEGRSAGLDACFAWQYSAQVRDELVRSGVRSLLQSISIFRMREMEDARSLAGLAMDVYSDRISIDQQEQERLRFSPDDILRLPVHTAVNLWVSGGVPRAGFIARTLPMEQLHDPALVDHHLAAQRGRGGAFTPHLPAPKVVHDSDDRADAALAVAAAEPAAEPSRAVEAAPSSGGAGGGSEGRRRPRLRPVDQAAVAPSESATPAAAPPGLAQLEGLEDLEDL